MIEHPKERLADTSFLSFWFFKRGEGLSPTKIKLPFYENITVTENQSPSYAEYNPLGRSGSLFTFTGTKSREFKVSFNLTFDHISKFSYSVPQISKPSDKDLFFVTEDTPENDSYAHLVNPTTLNKPVDDKITQLVMHWINLIRSSVVNNADDFSPPPLIRLNHGTMYRNVPCVCVGYDISHDESAGYERTSMLPKRLNITMNLKELRRNTITQFFELVNAPSALLNDPAIVGTTQPAATQTTAIDDYPKGWEKVINGKSMDPTHATFTFIEPI